MARNMLLFTSMQVLLALPANATLEDVLRAICQCDELETPVRKMEKKTLNELSLKVRFKLEKKARVQEPAQKAFVLIQAMLGGLEVPDFSMRMEVGRKGRAG